MKVLDINSDLVDVFKGLQRSETKTVYISKNGKLVGSITDGDIRRAFISRGISDLDISDVMNKSPTYRDNLGNIVNGKADIKINVIPLLSRDGEVVDESLTGTKFLPIAEPLLDNQESSLLNEAYDSTWISSQGRFINLFEEKFSEIHNVNHGISCANGTAALYLALSAIGLSSNDEVIIPTLTFGAVANSVILAGGHPVLVDTEADRPIMDLDKVVQALTTKTKAVIVVHSYGFVVDVKSLRKKLPSHVRIVEDCAEAHFAKLNNRLVGTLSDISCFSFFANKILTTGEGGMCLTSNDEFANRMRILRDHGMSPDKRYWHVEVGFNLRLTNLQAAIGVAQVNRKTSILEQRQASCQIWCDFLAKYGLRDCGIPIRQAEQRGLWLFNIRLNIDQKAQLKACLRDISLETRDFFYCLHKMPIFSKYKWAGGYNSEQWEIEGLSLPVYSDAVNNMILRERLNNVHHS